MGTKRVEIRFATEKDFKAFYGKPPTCTVRAIVADQEGEIFGIAGVRLVGMAWYGFADISEKLSKKQIAKAYRVFRKMMEKTNLPILVVRDETIESSGRFLAHLGFVQIETGEYLCQG